MATIFGNNDGSDTIDGTNFRDVIYGGSPSSRLANTGEDLIEGDDGDDDILGGDDDDDLRGQDDDDLLLGGAGDDALSGGEDDDWLVGHSGSDALRGGTGDDRLDGREGADDLEAGDGADILHADAGDFDVLDGEGGTDLLFFHAGSFGDGVVLDLSDPAATELTSDGTTIRTVERLLFQGGPGDDDATGGDFDDTLVGRLGTDKLVGDGGDDVLSGGEGSDRLQGSSGDDQLTGGDEADRFLFGDGHGDDVITDFETGEDVIDLQGVEAVDEFDDLGLDDLGSSVEVDYGDGSIVLAGVGDPGELSADDFLFA